jgi:hypothetical protein
LHQFGAYTELIGIGPGCFYRRLEVFPDADVNAKNLAKTTSFDYSIPPTCAGAGKVY